MAETKETMAAKLPHAPISRLAKPITRFLHIQAASGVVLLICTVAALILANSSYAETFHQFWKTKVGFSFGDFEFKAFAEASGQRRVDGDFFLRDRA